jgi:methionine synthase I (cobalamin-dependent)
MHPFLTKLQERPLLFDGAMGTLLYARGASSEQCLELLVATRPGWVTEVHQAYASAGADIIKSHTFGANRLRLAEYGLADRVREFNFKAVKLVRDVREVAGRALFIAGDAGPSGVAVGLPGSPTYKAVRLAYQEQISVLWEAGADLLLFETFGSLDELELVVTVAKEVCDLPVVASMTFSEDNRAPDGSTPVEVRPRC